MGLFCTQFNFTIFFRWVNAKAMLFPVSILQKKYSRNLNLYSPQNCFSAPFNGPWTKISRLPVSFPVCHGQDSLPSPNKQVTSSVCSTMFMVKPGSELHNLKLQNFKLTIPSAIPIIPMPCLGRVRPKLLASTFSGCNSIPVHTWLSATAVPLLRHQTTSGTKSQIYWSLLHHPSDQINQSLMS